MTPREINESLLAGAVGMISVVFMLTPYTFPVSIPGAQAVIFILCTAGGWAWIEVERRTGGYSYRHSLNPRNASWAFLADPAVAAGIAILASQRPKMAEYREAGIVLGVAVMIALLGAASIRLLDKGRYTRYNALGSYNALSKRVHDFFCLPLLLGSLAGMGVAVVAFGTVNNWFWVAVGCVCIWVAGAVKDVLREPNPLNQHANAAR